MPLGPIVKVAEDLPEPRLVPVNAPEYPTVEAL
jgi:hypothetical protein